LTDPLPRLTAALADRYRIERELGAGGMATVYLAADLRHDRQVAIKVLRPELAAVIGAERFLREIKTIAGLQHPHILGLIDSGEVDGTAFYVMPFVEGESLRDLLARKKQLPVPEATRIAGEIASALDYAHRHGIIHRDIKPENILLHDGQALVADFGIALAVSSAGGTRMTETGMSLGTPHYMSPEQAMGEREMDGRTDVYALGCVLYEMLAGEPPFTGPTAQAIVAKVVTGTPEPISTYRKTVPVQVAAAVHTALQKLPADRFETAKAFQDALADPHFSMSGASMSGAAVRSGGGRGLTMALGALLVLMTAVAGWALLRPAPPAPVIRYGLALLPNQAPNAGSGFAKLNSDGSRLFYLGPGSSGSANAIWMKRRDQLTATPIPGTGGTDAIAISPDDQWLAIVQAGALRKLPIDGGAFVSLTDGASTIGGGVSWLDNGSIVYVSRDFHSLLSIPEGGGLSTVLWAADSMVLSNLEPLPDGRGVLFRVCPPSCVTGDVFVFDFRAGAARPVVENAVIGLYLATGDLLFVRSDQTVLTVPFDMKSLTLAGQPVAVLDSVFMGGGLPYLDVSATGTVVMQTAALARYQEYTLVWVDRAGTVTPVDSNWAFRMTAFAGNYAWRLSPDGVRLAIGLNTQLGDDIWIKALPRGPVSRATSSEAPESRARWLADGRWITWVSPEGVWKGRADGTGTDSLLWPGGADEGVVSPDGRWLLIRRGASSAAAGNRDIFGMRLGVDTALGPVIVTPSDEMAITFSPDGRWLAYQSDETGRIEVFIRPFPNTGDGKLQVSNGGGSAPLWSRDGKELYYLSADRRMMAVAVTAPPTLSVSESKPLFRLPDGVGELNTNYYTPWDIAADGRFLLEREANPSRAEGLTAPLIIIENWFTELNATVRR